MAALENFIDQPDKVGVSGFLPMRTKVVVMVVSSRLRRRPEQRHWVTRDAPLGFMDDGQTLASFVRPFLSVAS